MEHPPKAISRVPDHMPKLPNGLETGTQESLQLLTADELICSEHLTHNVSFSLSHVIRSASLKS